MDDLLTDRDIRAGLRGAVKANVIDGWYWYGFQPNLQWAVNAGGCTTVYNRAGILDYCAMLREGGIEPRYVRLGADHG